MAVLLTFLALLLAALAAMRLYTVLAVHERRVVACWERLDTLLAQRNAHLSRLLDDMPAPVVEDRHADALRDLLERHERARRRGLMPDLVAAERDLRAVLETLPSQPSDHTTDAARRVDALQPALDEVAARYDAAVARYDRARRRPPARLLAPLFRFARYTPLFRDHDHDPGPQ